MAVWNHITIGTKTALQDLLD